MGGQGEQRGLRQIQFSGGGMKKVWDKAGMR